MNFRFWTKSWRKYSEEEWEHRQAARLLNATGAERYLARRLEDPDYRHTYEKNREQIEPTYRLGDSDGTRITEPTDGEACEPRRDQGE